MVEAGEVLVPGAPPDGSGNGVAVTAYREESFCNVVKRLQIGVRDGPVRN